MKNHQPLVSITMATYNIEEFIGPCLDCIVNQSLSDIEIICIDDGSKDKTTEILKEYASKDERIQVVYKDKNEGLAVARNEALKLAKGDYVLFLDGDDLYDTDLALKAYECAENTGSDLVLWDYVIFWQENEIQPGKAVPSDLLLISPNDKTALLQRPAFACLKLIKTELAKMLGIHFPVGLTRQDIPVHWHLITQIDKISFLPERLIYYRQQPRATTYKKDKKLFDLATVMDITKEYLMESGLYARYKDRFLKQQLNLLFGMVDNIQESLKAEALKKINERIGNDQWEYIKSKKPLRQQARDYYLSIDGSIMAKIRYKSWLLCRNIYRLLKK